MTAVVQNIAAAAAVVLKNAFIFNSFLPEKGFVIGVSNHITYGKPDLFLTNLFFCKIY